MNEILSLCILIVVTGQWLIKMKKKRDEWNIKFVYINCCYWTMVNKDRVLHHMQAGGV